MSPYELLSAMLLEISMKDYVVLMPKDWLLISSIAVVIIKTVMPA